VAPVLERPDHRLDEREQIDGCLVRRSAAHRWRCRCIGEPGELLRGHGALSRIGAGEKRLIVQREVACRRLRWSWG
jgi:hypothetical protein